MLANRFAVWTGLESQPVPDEDVELSRISVGNEPIQARQVEVTESRLREVLDTGLFSSRGENRMGWAHQTSVRQIDGPALSYPESRPVEPFNLAAG